MQEKLERILQRYKTHKFVSFASEAQIRTLCILLLEVVFEEDDVFWLLCAFQDTVLPKDAVTFQNFSPIILKKARQLLIEHDNSLFMRFGYEFLEYV